MKPNNRFSPLQISSRLNLKNRIVVPPMASSTADAMGYGTEQTVAHYGRLASSGAGLVFVEYSYVHPSGRSEDNQLGVALDAQVEGLARIAHAIRERGAVSGLQLTHGGGKSTRVLTGDQLMGPSGIAVPVKDQTLETPRGMTLLDIEVLQNSFLAAAGRAVAAGFDLIELHSAHGYGLNQWLSPLTNRRSDGYGQDRLRMLSEIITSIRTAHPQLAISVRMPGQDFIEGGLTLEDSVLIARRLEALGVNLLHVSSGIGGWRRPLPRLGEGYLVAEAAAIQSEVKRPVIGVGGIESGLYIDEALRIGKFSLAAVGRAILRDPLAWGRKELASAF